MCHKARIDGHSIDVYSAIPNVVALGKKLTSVFNEVKHFRCSEDAMIEQLVYRKLQRANRTKLDGHDLLHGMMMRLLRINSMLANAGVELNVALKGMPKDHATMRSAMQFA